MFLWVFNTYPEGKNLNRRILKPKKENTSHQNTVRCRNQEHYPCRWKPSEDAKVLGTESQDRVFNRRVTDFKKGKLLLDLSRFMKFACWGFLWLKSQKFASQQKLFIRNILAKSLKDF